MTSRYVSKAARAIGYLIQYGCISHCAFEYLGNLVVCTGPSMEPTLFSNNVLLTEHITPKLNKLQKGDVIIAKCPSNPRQHICKRVTGLPGDVIDHSNNIGVHYPLIVPRGYVWLEGDNSANSADSRMYGPVPLGLVRSRAICRIWPIQKFKKLTIE